MYRNHKRYRDRKFSNVALNHLENNSSLVSKKGLYFSIRDYCKAGGQDPLEIIPRTFYLQTSSEDENCGNSGELQEFIEFNRSISNNKSNMVDFVVVTPSKKRLNDDDITFQSSGATAENNKTGEMVENASVPSYEEALTRINECNSSSDSKSFEQAEVTVLKSTLEGVETAEAEAYTAAGQQNTEEGTTTSSLDTSLNIPKSLEAIWILKPASYANRGFGIKVVQGLNAVLSLVDRPSSTATTSSNSSGSSSGSSSPVAGTERLSKAAKKCAKKNGKYYKYVYVFK